MERKSDLLITSILLWNLFITTTCVNVELTLSTRDGQEHILDGYTVHESFFTNIMKFTGDKVRAGTASILSSSKIDIGQLLPNVNGNEYVLLQLLHSLSVNDTAFSNELMEFYSYMTSKHSKDDEDDWEVFPTGAPIINDWLNSNLSYPSDTMYNVANSIVNSRRNGLKQIPQPMIDALASMMNKSSILKKASEEGDIDVMNWLIRSNPSLDLKEALETAWHQGRRDIVQLLIENNAVVGNKELINTTNFKNETLLHLAAETNSPKYVNYLLRAGAVVDGVDDSGSCPLFGAVRNNDIGTVKLLIEKGANVSLETNLSNIPLHAASSNGNAEIAKILIESGSTIDHKNNYGITPLFISEKYSFIGVLQHLFSQGFISANDDIKDLILYYMISTDLGESYLPYSQKHNLKKLLNHSEIVKYLIMRGGKPFIQENLKSQLLKINLKNGTDSRVSQCLINLGARLNPMMNDTKEIFFHSVKRGNYELVSLLLNEGMPVSTRDINGTTALHIAASEGNIDLFYFLLKRGADIKAVTKSGFSILHAACKGGKLPLLKDLLNMGLNVNIKDKDGNTPLILSIRAGSEDVAKVLIDNGADPNPKGVYPTPLHEAARADSKYLINLLIDKGATVDMGAITALNEAVSMGKANAVKTLIGRGANYNVTVGGEITLLHTAVLRGYLDIVRILIDNGIDVNATSVSGKDPLHFAVSSNYTNITALLLDSGADINAQDRFEATPLHEAVSVGSLELVKLILAHGPDVNLKNQFGKTPLEWAVKQCRLPIIKALVEQGGQANSLLDLNCIAQNQSI